MPSRRPLLSGLAGPDLPRALRLLAVLVLTGAGACGGDGDTATGPDADARTTAGAVRVEPDRVVLDFLGATHALEARVLTLAGLPIERPVSWSSSDTTVATVSGEGVVTARGVGSTRVTAAAGDVSGFSDVTVRQIPRTLTVVSGDGQSAAVGALLEEPLVVEVRDEGGSPAPEAQLSWFLSRNAGSLESFSGRTDARGLGQARWRLGAEAGPHELRVVLSVSLGPTTPPHTAAVTFTGVATELVGPPGGAPVVVDSVTPALLVEGDSALVLGRGFGESPSGVSVVVDGLAASVLSASDSAIALRVPPAPCRPPRATTLRVSRGSTADTLDVEVTPSGLLALEPGEGAVAPSGCLHLAAGDGAREYLVGIQSTAPSAGTLTPSRLTGEAGTVPTAGTGAPAGASGASADAGPEALRRFTLPAAGAARLPEPRPPLRAAAGPPLPSPLRLRHRAAEAALRRAESAEIARMGGAAAGRAAARAWRAERTAGREAGPSGSAALQGALPAEGDTVTLGVGTQCDSRETVRAVTRYVGERTVWLEDTRNPAGGFRRADYESLDALHATAVERTLEDYFGPDRDLDGNGRLRVLVTRQVNAQETILGYVWAGDLYPRRFCRGSNEGEIFYGIAPDPDGRFGPALSTEAALAEYPVLVAHEMTHVIQRSEQIYGEAGGKDRWETEGGATLAEQLAGHAVTGLGSGQDLGWAAVDAWRSWYLIWVTDLSRYYGFRGLERVAGAPQECTWIGGEEQGNTGPCTVGRAVYGVPATLFRWILDRWGPGHPGGERGLMREMTRSPAWGYATLEEATGEDLRVLLAGFHAALWQDGRYGDALPSWDLRDIFRNLPASASLAPHTSTGAEPDLSLRVRGGSAGLLAWSPGPHPPTSLRVVATTRPTLPPFMAAWVVRLR